MNDLMIHVERIVRPVAATQERKLRMRTELLAHLQATFDEERERFPGNETAAIENAKLRLGEPAELTRKLQQAVPIVECTLMGRIPSSRRFDRWEQMMLRALGKRGFMTLGHLTILSVMAMLTCAPLLMSMFMVTTPGMPAGHLTLSLAGLLSGWPVLFLASSRLVFAAAAPDDRLNWPSIWKHCTAILAMQIGLLFVADFGIADRSATLREVIASAASTVALLTVSTLVARWIGVVRRPYDEWLTLDIAE